MRTQVRKITNKIEENLGKNDYITIPQKPRLKEVKLKTVKGRHIINKYPNGQDH